MPDQHLEAHREQWGNRTGFLLAAIGSAIGLGNIWRFPYIAYENGGGAFLVPYLIALLTAGLPLLIYEYALGNRFRGSAPQVYRRLTRRAEAIGWWQVMISFVIATYYAVIIAWAIRYAGFSIGQQWGDDPEAFLMSDFLQTADAPGAISSYVPGVAIPLAAVWIVTLIVLGFGVRRGIELANRILIPLLVVLFGILVIRAVTLPGAADGLNALFTPDWSAIGNGRVWVAAYGQIFFTLSVGFGIMITYASYLRRRADLTGPGLVAGLANSSFELLAGIGVFAAVGFMAGVAGEAVGDVVTQGVGLAFIAFPQIISSLPAANGLFGVLFFGSLMLAGLTSLISIVQVPVAAIQDKLGIGRIPAVLGVGGLATVVSLALYPTDNGLYILDATDHFINNFGIVLAALVSVVVIAWVLRRLNELHQHANLASTIRLGAWTQILLLVITPAILGWMTIDNLLTTISEGYEGYPVWFLIASGWAVAGGAIVVGIVLGLLPWRRRSDDFVPLALPSQERSS